MRFISIFGQNVRLRAKEKDVSRRLRKCSLVFERKYPTLSGAAYSRINLQFYTRQFSSIETLQRNTAVTKYSIPPKWRRLLWYTQRRHDRPTQKRTMHTNESKLYLSLLGAAYSAKNTECSVIILLSGIHILM